MKPALDDTFDAAALRAHLLAAQPMRRVTALYAIETEARRAGQREAAARGVRPALYLVEDGDDERRASAPLQPRLAGEVERFVARGIPFYAPLDAHYRAWVERAVAYWQRLRDAPATAC